MPGPGLRRIDAPTTPSTTQSLREPAPAPALEQTPADLSPAVHQCIDDVFELASSGRPSQRTGRRDLASLHCQHEEFGSAGVRILLQRNPELAARVASMDETQRDAALEAMGAGFVDRSSMSESLQQYAGSALRQHIARDAQRRIGTALRDLDQQSREVRQALSDPATTAEERQELEGLQERLGTTREGLLGLRSRFAGMTWQPSDFPRSQARAMEALFPDASEQSAVADALAERPMDVPAMVSNALSVIDVGLNGYLEGSALLDAANVPGSLGRLAMRSAVTSAGIAATTVVAGFAFGLAVSREVEDQRQQAILMGRGLGL